MVLDKRIAEISQAIFVCYIHPMTAQEFCKYLQMLAISMFIDTSG
jgi:hypothetical protein